MGKFITEDILVYLKNQKSDSIDLGITSPPYNKLEKNNGGLVKKVVYDKYKDVMSEKDYQEWQKQVLNELYRVIKPGGSFFYNHKVRYSNGRAIHPLEWLLDTKWKFRQEIIWNRKIAGNIRGWRFWPIEERIYWLYKPIHKKDNGKELNSKHALLTSIWEIRPEMSKTKKHPAPFPLEIPTRIIYSIFDDQKDKVIIDPFGGSGTTALASKLLGHNFITVDLDEKYTEISKQRNNEDGGKYHLISKEVSLHKVNKTYKQRKLEKNE